MCETVNCTNAADEKMLANTYIKLDANEKNKTKLADGTRKGR
jgi:hypothetical protein